MSQHPYRYAFGDEAGDPGFAFKRGSSRYRVFLLLLIDDPEPLRERVHRLRQELGLPDEIEFKFYKTSKVNRRAFLTAVRPYPFAGYALVMDKSLLPPRWRRLEEATVYAACYAELIKRIPAGVLDETIMVLDQYGVPETVLRGLRMHLNFQRTTGTARLFKKITFKRSRGDDLIQCADMVAGALMREVNERDSSFFSLIRNKVAVWRYEPKENPPS